MSDRMSVQRLYPRSQSPGRRDHHQDFTLGPTDHPNGMGCVLQPILASQSGIPEVYQTVFGFDAPKIQPIALGIPLRYLKNVPAKRQ